MTNPETLNALAEKIEALEHRLAIAEARIWSVAGMAVLAFAIALFGYLIVSGSAAERFEQLEQQIEDARPTGDAG